MIPHRSCQLRNSIEFSRKVDNVDIFALLKFETKLDEEINHFNFNSKHHDKCKFALKLIWYLTVFKLFSLEVVQKCQCCQLCVLQESSNGSALPDLSCCTQGRNYCCLIKSPQNNFFQILT